LRAKPAGERLALGQLGGASLLGDFAINKIAGPALDICSPTQLQQDGVSISGAKLPYFPRKKSSG
jgi:hypothetical protein